MFYVQVISYSNHRDCSMYFYLDNFKYAFTIEVDPHNNSSIRCVLNRGISFLHMMHTPSEIASSEYISGKKLSGFFNKPPSITKSLFKISKSEFIKFIDNIIKEYDFKLNHNILYFLKYS